MFCPTKEGRWVGAILLLTYLYIDFIHAFILPITTRILQSNETDATEDSETVEVESPSPNPVAIEPTVLVSPSPNPVAMKPTLSPSPILDATDPTVLEPPEPTFGFESTPLPEPTFWFVTPPTSIDQGTPVPSEVPVPQFCTTIHGITVVFTNAQLIPDESVAVFEDIVAR